jgi:hypothetical protein
MEHGLGLIDHHDLRSACAAGRARDTKTLTGRPFTKLFLFTAPARLFRGGPLAPIWYAPQHAFDSVPP